MFTKLLVCITIVSPLAMGYLDIEQVTNGNNQFANSFYAAISKQQQENILFSPLSAHISLAMLYQGAVEETATQFRKVLNVSNQNLAASGYEKTIGSLNNQQDVTLQMANKLYTSKDLTLKNTFKDVLTKSFASEVELINFAESEEAASTINQWVENKTNSKIKDMIEPRTLSAATRLILINAVYFKGSWTYTFPKKDTTTETFYVSEKESVDCQMMHLRKPLYYGRHDELNAQVLELRYSNSNISLVILLPYAMNGIVGLEKKLVDFDLSTITGNLYNHFMIDASLPKFQIETTVDLKPILEEMGLGIIFGPSADFSKITENSVHLAVSRATQKTFIEVNEEGTEATVATRFSVFRSGPQKFKANHPFIILLQMKYDGVTNTLFYGRIMKPSYN